MFDHFFNEKYVKYDQYSTYLSDDIISMISRLLSVDLAIDRSGILNRYSKYNIDIPSYIEGITFNRDMKYEEISLDSICYEVSSYYIDKANKISKNLGILYSGGVDSTLVTTAFLQNKKLNFNNFYIFLTNDSIKENEYFFNNIIKVKCQYILYNPYEYKKTINKYYNNFIFVSGHNGDQLFGHKFYLKHPLFYGLSYKKVLFGIYDILLNDTNNLNYRKHLAKYHASIYKHYFDNIFDFDIYTVEDFVWALNFMCKWIWVRLEHILKCNNINLINHYYSFYSHPLFQQWAVYKKKYKTPNNLNFYINKKFYKKEFKEYIYRYDKNKDYFFNKGKETSNVDYVNELNCNELVIYSNNGIESYMVNKRKVNSKYRDMFYLHQYLSNYLK